MLTAVAVKNYRAFEEARVAIKPITILLGANNVGKTSILQLFLLLQQTAVTQQTVLTTNRKYLSALKIHGKIVSMGDPPNLFHNRRVESPLEVSITFQDRALQDQLKRRI